MDTVQVITPRLRRNAAAPFQARGDPGGDAFVAGTVLECAIFGRGETAH